MQKKLYLTAIESASGKSFISIALVASLKAQFPNFCCYKLFSETENLQAPLLQKITQTPVEPLMDISSAIPLMRYQSEDLLARILTIIDSENNSDLGYFEGSDFESDNNVIEYEFNITIAYQLDCEIILVVSAKDRTLSHTLSIINDAIDIARKKHARIGMIIINRVNLVDLQEAKVLFDDQLKPISVVVVPEFDNLANPTVGEMATKLNAKVICGANGLGRMVSQITVAAKTVANFLVSRVDRASMVIITPSDRIDILLGSLLADQSSNYPKIAGIILTGGEMPSAVILDIITGLEHAFPVLLTTHATYETATLLYSARYHLSVANFLKAELVIDTISPYLLLPLSKLANQPLTSIQQSPAIFLYNLNQSAVRCKRHIVLPEGEDIRIIKAADYLLKRSLVSITLLGNEKNIRRLARLAECELAQVKIIDLENNSYKKKYADCYFQLRKHKNVNISIATERMTDVNYFAAMMVYCGDADAMVSGALHTTADTVRPALEIIKTKPGVEKVSSVFIMCMPSRVLIYGDCAINPEPSSDTLAEIAEQAALIAIQLGLTPRIALLSYSSGSSGKGASVDKVSAALSLLQKRNPELLAEGPLQYDAAVDSAVALKKLPSSKIAGNANVLIFPDLNTGNNTYKAVQRESGALAIGPVLLGLNKPVNDLSRGCSVQDIINTILVTAIQVGDVNENINN